MMKTETKTLRVHVFSKKERTRSLKSKSILVMRAVSSSSSFQEEEDDYLEDADEEDEYYSFDDGEDFERAQQRERVGQRTSDRQRGRLATGFGKGRKNASSSSSSSLSSSRENEQKLAALIDGGEVFFLSTAVAMKARQVYVEQRARAENENASVASSSGGALMDLPLYLAVVVGAVLRRASTSASGSGMFSSVFSSGDKVKFPRAVNARVQNLEVGLERLDENQRRYSRDVSRLGTRVRLTRRELSPMIRRAEATSVAFGEVAAELAKRIEVAEEEGSKLAETMASLHAVSAKQFEVLSKSVRELRAAMKELEMEAEEAAMMTSEEIAFSKKTNGIINSSRFAKKEELEKLERMLTEALEEMEDCLTTMVREKAIALGEEIDDISLMEDDSDANDDEEREEEKKKELVWVGESSAQKKKSALLESKSQNAGKSADDDEKKIAAENEPPTIQLYKFDEFNSSSSSRSSNSSSSSTDDESGTRRDVSDE